MWTNNRFNLADVGTLAVPGVKFVGRLTSDELGGGQKQVDGTNPAGGSPTLVHSRGVAALGDIDGDGLRDYSISAMLADPNNRTDSGEIYILYGYGQ